MVGTWRIEGHINGRMVLGRDPILYEPRFQFLAADVCQHLSIDFHAWREFLAALLDHLHPLIGIIPNIPIFKWEIILVENGTDTLTPTAVRFEIRDYVWFIHARSLRRAYIRRN